MRKKSIWSGILALWLLALASCTGTDPGTTVKKPSAPLTSEGDSSFSEEKNSTGEASLSPLPPSVDVTDFPSLSGSQPASEDTVSPTSAPTPTPTPTSDPTPKVPPSEEELRGQVSSLKHYEESYLPDRTVEEVGIHVEESVAILLRRVCFSSGSDAVRAYVADVYVKEVSQIFGEVLTDRVGNLVDGTPEQAYANTNALLLLNSDYLRARSWGLYVRNGNLFRNKEITGIDICAIDKTGKMRVYNGDTVDKEALLADENLWHIFSFGPSLLNEDGSARDKDSQFHITDRYSRWNQYDSSVGFPVTNPRTAIGQAEDGHYILVAVDGRKKNSSRGMTFPELSHLLYEEGAEVAYNLDGGGSVLMYFQGEKVNNTGGNIRTPGDYICILPSGKNEF